MEDNDLGINGSSGPIIYTENVAALALAIASLAGCRGKKLKNALAGIKGFNAIRVAKDVTVGGIIYWRTLSFVKEGGSCINISIPYVRSDSALDNPIAIFVNGIVGIDNIEALVGRISEELIKEN